MFGFIRIDLICSYLPCLLNLTWRFDALSNLSWTDLIRPDLSLPNLTIPNPTCPDLTCPDLSYPDQSWPKLSWSILTCSYFQWPYTPSWKYLYILYKPSRQAPVTLQASSRHPQNLKLCGAFPSSSCYSDRGKQSQLISRAVKLKVEICLQVREEFDIKEFVTITQ